MTQVLEHVRDPFTAASEIKRILKKEGLAFISTHGLWEIHRLPKDYWRFTNDSLEELFKDFKKIKIIPNGGTMICAGQFINLTISLFYISILKIPIIFFWIMINIITLFLDKIIKDDKFIINYTIILKK